MKKNEFIFFLALVIALSLEGAGSAEAALCRPYSDLSRPVASCDDNFALSESAMNCVESFERAVEQGKARVQKLLGAQVARMKDQQNDSFDRSSSSYQDAQNELKRLISEGEQAKRDVDTYGPELYFPEDYNKPNITGISQKEYLATEPCFAAPNEIVYGASSLLQEMIDDLKSTNLAALEKDARSTDRSDKVQNSMPGSSAAQDSRGNGGSRVGKSGKEEQQRSKVTGVKESMEREKRAKH